MNDALKEQLQKMINKSWRTLKASKDLLKNNDFESASSRAYYSVYYIIEALLVTKNLSFSKHSAVISAFSKYFIKEGVFPVEFAKEVRQLKRNREIGDYEYEVVITNEHVKEDVDSAKKIIKSIEKYLEEFM